MSSLAGHLVTQTLDYDGGRRVTVYVPPAPVDAVVFAADGAWHVTQLSEALESVSASSTMIVGVHGMPDDDGRLLEYVPGFDAARFAEHEEFFVGTVNRWVKSRFGIALPAERVAVWGASLGAEFALAMGLGQPEIYGAVLAVSPGGGYKPPGSLSGPLPRVYLAAGKQEQFFLDNATTWAAALRNAGADVAMMERDGEHGGSFWAEEFPLMVAWAFEG